jgi:hypothetical protein
MSQAPNETYNPTEQCLMLDIVLNNTDDDAVIDIKQLKAGVREAAPKVTDDTVYEKVRDELKAKVMPAGEVKPVAPAPTPDDVPAGTDDTPPAAEEEHDKHDKKHKDKEKVEAK